MRIRTNFVNQDVDLLLLYELLLDSQELLQEERERNEQVRSSWRKLLDRCKILQDQLQECNIDNLTSTKGDTADSLPSLLDQLDFVGTSENQIDLLIAEVHS